MQQDSMYFERRCNNSLKALNTNNSFIKRSKKQAIPQKRYRSKKSTEIKTKRWKISNWCL